MTLLPIFSRELLSRSRSRSTYWTRCAVALVGLLVCLESIGSAPLGSPARMGRFVFDSLVSAAFVVSCSVCLLAADAISGERREGTLGLLFLTRVKAVDVLLAKLGSVGITSLGALAAFLPVLMIPVLAGGVTGGEAFRKGLALINLLFFSMVAGLCASASQQERFRAVRRALLILGLTLIVPFLPFAVGAGGWLHWFSALSPLVTLLWAGQGHYTSSAPFFWSSLVCVQLLAWVLLLRAGFRLRRADGEDGAEARPRPPAEQSQRAIGLVNWQPAKEDSSPIEWLVFRQSGVGAGIWAIGLLALAYNGWVPLARPPLGFAGGARSWFFAGALAVVGGLCGGAVVAWVASRFFVSVRRTGELELLLTTPLGVETLVSEQWSVLKRFFVWPVLVMQAPLLPQILAGLSMGVNGLPATWQNQTTLLKLLSLANTFLGTAALCWLGLWFGSRSRTQAGAIVWTVGLAKGIPSLLTLFCSVIGQGLFVTPRASASLVYAAITWIPEAIILLFYLWLIGLARQRLSGHFEMPEPVSDEAHLSVFSAARGAFSG